MGARHIKPLDTGDKPDWLLDKDKLREKFKFCLDPNPPAHPVLTGAHQELILGTDGSHGAVNHLNLHVPSDFDLNPGMRKDLRREKPLRAAAVLIAIMFHHEGPTILFTQRTAQLANHPGQISFPGGKIDNCDQDASAAALREAHEELGIHADYVEPLGFLDCYETRSGFLIAPLVALLDPNVDISTNTSEVEESFEVPLTHLMNPDNHRKDARTWNGISRNYYALPYETRYIWGATAGILVNMHERLFLR